MLQNWFDFRIPLGSESDAGDNEDIESMEFECDDPFNVEYQEMPKDSKIQNIVQAIVNLKSEPIPIFCASICRAKNFVPAGVLRRTASLAAFAEVNVLNLIPLNSLDFLLDVEESVERIKFTDHGRQIYCIDISHSNTLLATGSADFSACIYDLNDMKLLHKCEGHIGTVYSVKISHTGEYLATGSSDSTARLWEVATGRTLRLFVAHTGSVISLDFHPNCLYLATGSSDQNIRMWCLSKAVTLRLLVGCKSMVFAVTYSPAGKYLASASDDRRIRIWDLLTSKALVELRYEGSPCYRLIWNKSGSELCAGSNNAIIRVWNVKQMEDSEWKNGRYEPCEVRKLVGRLLNLEYAFGTYGALSVLD